MCLGGKAPAARVHCWDWSSWAALTPRSAVMVVGFGSWHSVPFLVRSLCCRLTRRLLQWCCRAWKHVGVWQGCFPSSAWYPCIFVCIDAFFPGYVTFLLHGNISSIDLYFSVIAPKLSITDESSIICEVTIKASGLIWGSGPPLPFSLTIVLNPLMLQRNRTFIRWSIGGQGADNRFYCIWDIAVLFLRTARQIGNHGHG